MMTKLGGSSQKAYLHGEAESAARPGIYLPYRCNVRLLPKEETEDRRL